jgi:glycine/D-amino acid oxidase-like deaminating enzyme
MVIREVTPGQAGLPTPNSTASYWHQSPSQILLGHRTTPDLPNETDVVIIGSGITGAFAAWFLKHPQDSLLTTTASATGVVMLEAREACWGATGRNGGHCQPMLWASPPDVAMFELATYRFLRKFVEMNGVDCDWVSLEGACSLLSEDKFEEAVKLVRRLKAKVPHLGGEVDVVWPDGKGDGEDEDRRQSDGRSERREIPTLSDLGLQYSKGAVLQRNAASLWPYKLVAWVLEALLQDFGGSEFNLQTNTPVLNIRRQSDSDLECARPWIVTTSRGQISARKVLVCANGYTSRLIPAFADLIVPTRGQVAALLPPTTAPDRDVTVPGEMKPVHLRNSYNFVDHLRRPQDGRDPPAPGGPEKEDYLVQRPGPQRELIFGGGRFAAHKYAVGEWHDDVVEESVSRHLRGGLGRMLDLSPSVKEAEPNIRSTLSQARSRKELEASHEWTGVMGYSRDRRPWVGRVPQSMGGGPSTSSTSADNTGLWVCGGYTGHGMPVAALCARTVVGMMMGSAFRTADDDGVESTHAVFEMLENVQMPYSYLLTEERIERARTEWLTVAVQEQGSEARLPQASW